MTRSPRAAALLLLLALAVHGASAICGPDWTRLKIRHGKVVGPFMPDDAVAMATISEDTFRQIRGGISRCKLLSTDILRACKKPVIKKSVIQFVRVDSVIQFNLSCKYGKRAPVAHTARYSSTANMHKRQPAYLLANKVRFLSSN